MKVVIAIDSLKDSLTSFEAGKAVEAGIRKVYDQAEIVVKPLADGGEGTVDALVEGLHGEKRSVTVLGPKDNKKVDCPYGFLPDSQTAIIEMAGAAGIGLVPAAERNPLYTTTYGVGEVIVQAIKDGARNFIIGIGGSVTNDCGIGMLQALGYVFTDKDGKPVGLEGKEVEKIAAVDDTGVLPAIFDCTFNIACDVNNPLYGENGATYIFGPQKGATPDIVKRLDAGSRSFAAVTAHYLGQDLAETPGAGAAGGLGFAFLAYVKGNLQPGVQIVLDAVNLADAVKGADYVVTGEGRLDAQTAMGKAPSGVARLAKEKGATVIALAGCTTDDAKKCNEHGIDAFFAIVNAAMPLEEAMRRDVALKNMTDTAEQAFRLVKSVKK